MAIFWERAALSSDRMFSLYYVYLYFLLFPLVVLGKKEHRRYDRVLLMMSNREV